MRNLAASCIFVFKCNHDDERIWRVLFFPVVEVTYNDRGQWQKLAELQCCRRTLPSALIMSERNCSAFRNLGTVLWQLLCLI
uniref:Secreted protein n=1 Tax=Ascaris lumbricoides TaxID=6252 RepID=A0A0M3INM8_ASCLU